MPVDLYVGGAEHAVLHLLYARFWHKVLYDRGYVSMPEPFHKLVNQGMILGENGREDVQGPRQRGQSPTRSCQGIRGRRAAACTRCSWARWRPSSPGARKASAASPVFSIASGG